jgi:hypothetical protein
MLRYPSDCRAWKELSGLVNVAPVASQCEGSSQTTILIFVYDSLLWQLRAAYLVL